MRSDFIWQRRAALWGSALVGIYCLLGHWVFQPLHTRGWFQPVLAQLNGLSWIAFFPGYVIVAHTGLRELLSPPHRTSAVAWWIIWTINLVLWAVALRLLLGIIFPVKKRNASVTPGQSASGAPAEARSQSAGALALCPGVGDDRGDTRLTTTRAASTSSDAPGDVATADGRRFAPAGAFQPFTTRRRFLTNTARLAVASVLVAGGYSMLLETRWFQITRRRHAIRGLHPDLAGLRLVQLTDIHHGPALSLNYVREVIAAANALKPDLILLTGDYVHRSPAYIDPVLRELAELRASIGIVGVLGNHDWWESAPLTRVCFANAGIPLIDNGRRFLWPDRKLRAESTNAGLCIAGVGDYMEDRIRLDLALGDVPAEVPRLLLSHNPDVAEYPPLVAGGPRVDLMLAGHTHGGQIRLPGLGTPIVPSRFGSKYARGLVQGPACPVYISRGIGTTILPLRFRAPPEITVIELDPA